MNSYAMFAADEALRVANERLAALRFESRNHALAERANPWRTLTRTVQSVFSPIRDSLAAVADQPAPLPKLTDYPYRS